MEMMPVAKRNDAEMLAKINKQPEAGGISFPMPPEPTWKSKGPGGSNVAPMGFGLRYKHRLELLRRNRPFFLNIMDDLRYIVSFRKFMKI